jgi:hypothetical protein
MIPDSHEMAMGISGSHRWIEYLFIKEGLSDHANDELFCSYEA